MKIFTNDQIRAIEQYTIEKEGVSSNELIERAAAAMTAGDYGKVASRQKGMGICRSR